MLLKRASLTFVFLITFTLVFSYLNMNYQPISAQVFEFQEDDYFDVDEQDRRSSTNTNDNYDDSYSDTNDEESANTNEDYDDDSSKI
jgi:hypothetical protein